MCSCRKHKSLVTESAIVAVCILLPLIALFGTSAPMTNKQVEEEETWEIMTPRSSDVKAISILPCSLVSITDDAEEVLQASSGLCPLLELSCEVDGSVDVCVPREKWCDGHVDCPNGKDEGLKTCVDAKGFYSALREGCTNFELFTVPRFPYDSCTSTNGAYECMSAGLTSLEGIPYNLTHLNLKNNSISGFQVSDMQQRTDLLNLDVESNLITDIEPFTFPPTSQLRSLFLDYNSITRIEPEAFSQLENLCYIKLAQNRLTFPSHEPFPAPPNCVMLDASYNRIRRIANTTFSHMKELRVLLLNFNRIETLSDRALHHQEKLTDLDLSNNRIEEFPEKVLFNKENLVALDISVNKISHIHFKTLSGAPKLNSLNLTDLDLRYMEVGLFEGLDNLTHVYFPSFDFCRFVPQARVCLPKGDGISTFTDLLGNVVLRVAVWLVGLTTCLANLGVLIWRIWLYGEKNVTAIFIKSLAVSDFLMGIFLLNVGSHDILYRDQYNRFALLWMTSWDCQAGGMLAMLSSEASILLLTVMSVERYAVVAFPYQWKGLSLNAASTLVAAIWVIAFALALAPRIPLDSLYAFYGSNSVCFPLHIHEPYMHGWQYSALIFLGINGVAFVVMLFCYLGMCYSIRRTEHLSGRTIDVSISKRLFLLVLTNALCWVPIMIIKTLAFARIPISNKFYAWLAIFVLPVNSSTNPILYSISTPAFKRNFHDHMPDGLSIINLSKRGASLSTSNGTRTSVTSK